MSGKKPERKKHIPQRTCVGCREILPKRQLVRIVKSLDGVRIDTTGKLQGRGAYMHDLRSCWLRGLKGPLAKALRTEIKEQEMTDLVAYMEGLPEDVPAEPATSETNEFQVN